MSAVSEVIWASERPKAQFRSFFDHAPVVLAQCQIPGRVTAVNPVLERMLGALMTMQCPTSLAQLINPDDPREADRQLLGLLEGKREAVQIDSKQADRRGALRWTAWRMSPVNGHPVSVLAMAQEVAADTELETRLQRAARLESLGKLAGGVAHDFNNVLTGVLLYCDLLNASLDPSHRARKYAEEIRNAALQASGLVRQMLAVARPQRTQPRLLSLNEIAEGMRNLLVHLTGQNIELKLRLDPNLGLIKLDTTQAQQILLNLVINARDAMPRGGRILIETRNCRLQALSDSRLGTSDKTCLPCALLLIEDNGCGMDQDTRAHMFEPFFTTKEGTGSGLGLTTVHEIVTSNGGLIHVSSEPAQGTRISVLLPLVAGTVPEPASRIDLYPRTGEVFSSQEEE
jgi:two-component system, cell cycle sensor histidine kinase and response regulator CckA